MHKSISLEPLSSAPLVTSVDTTSPLVTMLPRLPPSRQTSRGKQQNLSASSRLYLCENVLTPEQKAVVMERYRQALDEGRLSLSTIEAILQDLNLVPPQSFHESFLEGAGWNARHIRTTPRSLAGPLVGRMLRLAEATTHDALVKDAYEAMNGKDSDLILETSATLHPGRSTHTATSSTAALQFVEGSVMDPMDRILKRYAAKGLRPLQTALSNGDPHLLRTFIRLGGRDDGAGYVTTSSLMASRCEALGMTDTEASEVSSAFDSHRIGEIEFDDFLRILKMDLSRLPLSLSALIWKLKRLVVSGSITQQQRHHFKEPQQQSGSPEKPLDVSRGVNAAQHRRTTPLSRRRARR